MNFNFSTTPQLYFGSGSIKNIPSLIKGSYCLIVTGKKSFTDTKAWTELQNELKQKNISFDLERIETEPSPEMIDRISNQYKDRSISTVIGIGGGSVMDAGKAISAMLTMSGSVMDYLEGVGTKTPSGSKIPYIAVPLTAGTGSEATMNAVISRPGKDGFKKSLRHPAFIPDFAVVDPQLALSCPPSITMACAMDALTQLIEATVSTKASPITKALSLSGLEKISAGIPGLLMNTRDLKARENLAYGTLMSGITLANAGLGTVHGFASVIGGRIAAPHGLICGILLFPVTRITIERLEQDNPQSESLDAYRKIAEILTGKADLNALLEQINKWVKLSKFDSLADYGLKHDDIPFIAKKTGNKNNPWALEEVNLVQILNEII